MKPAARSRTRRAPRAPSGKPRGGVVAPTTFATPELLRKKRDGQALSSEEIDAFIAGVAGVTAEGAGRIPDDQVAAMLMAIVWRGLDAAELERWTQAMIASGDRLSLGAVKGRKVDKHSTGGVGDKITICLAPLVAACDVPTPMLVGRALGHTGGTLDKLAAIPGWIAELDARRFERQLARWGFVIAGQSASIVPADKRLYALRDATATVESIPLIASSILSKKVAGGADALVLDVKIGRGAFLPPRMTRQLARTLVTLGGRLGLPTTALLTSMDEPLGREIGNANELGEALEILRGEGPSDTRALTVRLGAEMLRQGGVVRDLAAGAARIEAAIASGAGWERLVRGVAAQGGDVRVLDGEGRLPSARRQHVLKASRAGYVTRLDARAFGLAATALGAGRFRREDVVDPAVGITLHVKEGVWVAEGEGICTLWYNDSARLGQALGWLAGESARTVEVSGRPPPRRPLIRGHYP